MTDTDRFKDMTRAQLIQKIEILEISVSSFMGLNSKTQQALKTHCYVGHEYTPENTRVDNRGYRFCRTCARINGRVRLKNFRIRQAIANAAET